MQLNRIEVGTGIVAGRPKKVVNVELVCLHVCFPETNHVLLYFFRSQCPNMHLAFRYTDILLIFVVMLTFTHNTGGGFTRNASIMATLSRYSSYMKDYTVA